MSKLSTRAPALTYFIAAWLACGGCPMPANAASAESDPPLFKLSLDDYRYSGPAGHSSGQEQNFGALNATRITIGARF